MYGVLQAPANAKGAQELALEGQLAASRLSETNARAEIERLAAELEDSKKAQASQLGAHKEAQSGDGAHALLLADKDKATQVLEHAMERAASQVFLRTVCTCTYTAGR